MRAVTVDKIIKKYTPDKAALDGVSFSLEEGTVFGFLGPNGAGKTTCVKLLIGMLSPTGGTCRVFDIDPVYDPVSVHRMSGIITEHALMYDNLTGLQNLVFYGSIYGLDTGTCRKRAKQLLESLGLESAGDRKLAAYSTGMRQRLSLARAMIHRPRILFLDEPTSGLDPESTQAVNNMIMSLAREEGTTVFLCTHQLRYAQEICTNYGLIDEGELLAAGDMETLRSMVFSGMTVSIKTDRIPPGIEVFEKERGYYEVNVQTEEEIPAIIKRIVDSGGRVYHVSARKLSLEEIYFALIEKRQKKVGDLV